MNNKGEFNTQGMLIAGLIVGLFFAVIASTISIMSGVYSITGYDESDLQGYTDIGTNISAQVQKAYDQIDTVTVNPNLFDYLAGLFNKVLAPFKFIYRSFTLILGMVGTTVSTLNLLPIFSEFIASVIVVLVIIGIVMLKIFLNRQK